MSYYILPEIYNKTLTIELECIENKDIYVSKTLHFYLNNIKKQIDQNNDSWDFIKKYTNPYEFIHTMVPNLKYSVSKIKPLSRSFYKMIEMTNIFHLLNDFANTNINTFHLAEGPGGFIEATAFLRKNFFDNYYGMTLINEDPNVPGWKKTNHFLSENKNVKIEYGPSNNGNLLLKENLVYCHDKYKGSMELITADGGFDFSIDFNQQEILATKLLYAQVSFAIAMQKKNGHFILKIFDIFTKSTVDIIYLLSSMYKQVFIIKPNSSRLANSEKYIVCKYFKNENEELIQQIINNYEKLSEINYLSSLIKIKHDCYFLNKIEEYNAIFGQMQIENINNTLNLINFKNKNDKLDFLKKNNTSKCIQWCEKNNIPYNNLQATSNIFTNI